MSVPFAATTKQVAQPPTERSRGIYSGRHAVANGSIDEYSAYNEPPTHQCLLDRAHATSVLLLGQAAARIPDA